MRLRLSVMMALVYAVQGAFWPLLAAHMTDLGIGGSARGWVFATLAIGSVTMSLGAGQLVDRRFAGEKLLGTIFLIASVLLVVPAAGWAAGPWALYGLFQVFWLVAAPAFALSNAIAFRHLERPYEEFAGVRLWGTIGWMAVGWLVSVVLATTGSTGTGQGAFESFWVASILAAVLGVFSFTLPHTPPLATAARPGLRDALALARRPGVPGFLVTALGVHMTTPFIYQVLPSYLESRGLGRAWVPTALTLGQWPEIVALGALPWFFRRLGVKGTLGLGIGAWVVRFGSLTFDPPLWVALAGMLLHGIGIACFTVAGQMYMDRLSPPEQRAGSQALYFLCTSGLGSLLGSLLAGSVAGRLAGQAGLVFFVPCVIDAALLVYFCAGFQPNARAGDVTGASHAALPLRHDAVRGSVVRVGNLVTESADG